MSSTFATLGPTALVIAAAVAVAPARPLDALRAAQSEPGSLPAIGESLRLREADCTVSKLGTTIPAGAIGEPVAGVTLAEPRWSSLSTGSSPSVCTIEGSIAPIDPAARPINFRVTLPGTWSLRAAHLGGAGMNGTIPSLVDGRLRPVTPAEGFVTYGSDSGHSVADPPEWTLVDEAVKNLGYMQLKKTHDAAMVLVERMYGRRPAVSYFIGTSQGGREALTVAQRYPDDYDGIIANVPIVNFSTLMLAPELIRIQEKPLANWATRAKVNAIRGEFMRRCDGLDGLVDGVINDYQGCREIFDVHDGGPDLTPWSAKRCPGNVDPDPADTSAGACFTQAQISTLEFVYSRYRFAAPLANGVRFFGMWLPNIDPSGSGLIADTRFRGQEGAAPDAPLHSHLGVLGVSGFLMRDVHANPIDYVEGGRWQARRQQLSEWLDATNPDLTRFAARGGKIIVTIGTGDTLASPGAQLDYYQSLVETMGRARLDGFARLFVMPQTGHGLNGANYGIDGAGKAIPVTPIPNTFDKFRLLAGWVERKSAPGMSVVVSAGDKSLPLCSYPSYPRYNSGSPALAESYSCR